MSWAFGFSAGRNTFDNTPQQKDAEDFNEFVEHFETNRGRTKGQNFVCGPMEFGAHDEPEKHPGDAHYRLARHAKPCRFLSMDIDHMAGPQVKERVLVHIKVYRSYAYETASSTPDSPRMRVVFDLDREVSRDERIALGEAKQAEIEAAIEAEFGSGAIKFDPSVYRPEQPNYNPLMGANDWKFFDAPPLKVDNALAYEGPRVRPVQQSRNKSSATTQVLGLAELGPVPGYIKKQRPAGQVTNAFAGATRVLKTEFLIAQLSSALAATPSDDRHLWVAVGHALKTLDVDEDDVGKTLWLSWSAKSPKFDPDEAERVWHSLYPTSTTHEQEFVIAEKYGWEIKDENARIQSALGVDEVTPHTEGGTEPRAADQTEISGSSNLNVTTYGENLLSTVEAMPRRDWKIHRLLLGRYISLIMGPGGVAKSMLQLIAAVSVATGRDLLGLGPVKQCNALVINNEDDEDELRRRIAAVAISFDVDTAELEDRLFTVSGYQNPVRFAFQVENNLLRAPAIAEIEAIIKERNIGALFVDPFIATHTAPENDNNAMDQVVRACGHSGFPFCLISDSNFQNGGLNERTSVCGVGRLVAAA